MDNYTRIGVTGATGHIGHNLVKKLLQSGYQTRILLNSSDSLIENPLLEKYWGSIDDDESMHSFCENLDVVIHLAAVISIGNFSTEKVFQTNIEGTKILVAAALEKKVKRFIHFSSIHAFNQEPLNEILDETRLYATNSWIDYDRSKAITEKWVLEQNTEEFNVIVLNPTSVIGPEDLKPSLVGEMLQLAYKGKIPGVVKGGFDWVDVRDITDAAIAAIHKGQSGNNYILSGNWHSIKDITDEFIRAGGKNKRMIVLPNWLASFSIPFMNIFSKLTGSSPLFTKESLHILKFGNQNISNRKASEFLNYSPRPMKETIEDTFNWFNKNKYL